MRKRRPGPTGALTAMLLTGSLGAGVPLAHASEDPATPPAATPAPATDPGLAPDGVFARLLAGPDTVHYRVCKDLSVCELSFQGPAPEVLTGSKSRALPPAFPLSSRVPGPPPTTLAAAPGFPWWLLAVPAAGLVFTGRHHGLTGTEITPPPNSGPPSESPELPPSRPPTVPPGTPPRTPPSPPPSVPPPPPGPPTPPPPPETVTPEPATLLLLGSGLAGLAALRKRRR